MAKEEKTLSEEDWKRIQKAHDIFEFKTIHDTFGVSAEEFFKAGAEYEHKYQREQQAQLRNKEWTDILTTSELADYAKQYWTSKLIGGAEPNLTDMFIAGFRLGVEKTKELP